MDTQDTQDYKIVNMVFSGSTGRKLDLDKIYESFDGMNVNYDRSRFPGLILRFNEPKITISMFRSGKMVFTGLKSEDDMNRGLELLKTKGQECGLNDFDSATSKLQNIVCTINLGYELFLSRLSITLGFERVEFEPEQFPGLILRYEDPKVVFLMFGSGRVVCTGGKSRDECSRAVESLKKLLKTIEGM